MMFLKYILDCYGQHSRGYLLTGLLLCCIFLGGCVSGSQEARKVKSFESAANESNASVVLNRQIKQLATAYQTVQEEEYHLGSGDVLELTVFQADELNKVIRVNGRGKIILPLLGSVDVAGKSLVEAEEEITARLAADFLNNPQVSLFLTEYRSQQITVMGAVENPNVYSIRQSRTIFEMLSLAGGMTEVASDKIRVKTTQTNAETGEREAIDLLLSVNSLLEGADAASGIRLAGGDSILVPEAGVIFVTGAVKKPDSYKMEGSTNVLKAVSLAGGVLWEGKEAKVQVIREINQEQVSVVVNLDQIRNQKEEDIELKDGDIVVVDYSTAKRGISGFFRTAGQILGYQL